MLSPTPTSHFHHPSLLPHPSSYLPSPSSPIPHYPPTCPLPVSLAAGFSSLPLLSFFPPSPMTCCLPSHFSLLVPSKHPTPYSSALLLFALLPPHPLLISHLSSFPLLPWLRPLPAPPSSLPDPAFTYLSVPPTRFCLPASTLQSQIPQSCLGPNACLVLTSPTSSVVQASPV